MSETGLHYGAADIRYVAAFDPEISPARLHLSLAMAGTAWNPADRERLTVLDIGCGRGLNVLLLAAANPGWDVIGLDLQPVHIAEATEMAAEAGLANARFIEADLAELTEESSAALLPELDIVLCNGVWTWVPDAVRDGIVRLLRARVAPGGLVVMGYNSLPGCADCIPLQRVLADAVRDMPGSESARGAHALAVLESLRDAGARYLPPPKVLDHIIATARAAPAYMAHEWFTPFWRPVFHADLARDLAGARLDYGGPTRVVVGLPDLQLTAEQRDALGRLPRWIGRETATDAFLERRFRADIFVRGRRPAAPETLGDIRFALGIEPRHAVGRLGTQSGVASLPEAQFQALVAALAHGPARVRDLAALPEAARLSFLDIALMLSETLTAHPLWRDIVPDPAAAARARRCNETLLRHLSREAFASSAVLGAVVPALGSAFSMGVSDLSIVAAIQSGTPAEPDALAHRLSPRKQDAEATATVRDAVAATLDHHLGAWRGLGLL
jgi:SAM-dependent methyltransferase